jgi:hypothetical protein
MKIQNKNQGFCLFILVVFALLLDGSPKRYHPEVAHSNQASIDWDKIRRIFIAYLKSPTSENGTLFVEALPRHQVYDADQEEVIKTIDLILGDGVCSPFSRRVIEGDRNAVEALFRMLNITDAGATEMVLELIGEVVRQYPRIFLAVLYEYKDSDMFKIGGYPVKMNRYEINSEEERRELRMRIKALETVKDPIFADIRDECIRELRRILKNDKS